jgi:acetolactate synthase-1/2/3 large subunit
MTTYNGADRVDGDAPYYLGRPNTWGQRSSNIIIQKSDCIIAVGTRLGLQQTGFNWQAFGRDANIFHIDIDWCELNKGHPHTFRKIQVDANNFLECFMNAKLERKDAWLVYSRSIREKIPRIEDVNKTGEAFISPYQFMIDLESITKPEDLIIPCSSGSAFTLAMQLYKQKFGQRMLTNKSLASMGYGLSGAIGAAFACHNERRTILIEGDGGFAQNMQELGTAELNNLNLKIFIFNDQGHASIRMTQINYFHGKYLGCDRTSGLGLPDWARLFYSWNIPVMECNKLFSEDVEFLNRFNSKGIQAFLVMIDPTQTYFPKIASRLKPDGSMESNPLHLMSPELEPELAKKVFKYIKYEK